MAEIVWLAAGVGGCGADLMGWARAVAPPREGRYMFSEISGDNRLFGEL